MTSPTGIQRTTIALALALSVACGRCDGPDGDSDPGPDGATVEPRPNTPEAMSLYVARLLPADTLEFVALRDLSGLLASYQRLRPHVAATVGESDLGMVETDLRNTLGLDLSRAGSLDDAGIASNGGAALARIGDRPVIAVVLADRERFVERLTTTLQSPPFNLRHEVERATVLDLTVLYFRATQDSAPEVAVALHEHLALLLTDLNPGDVEAVAAALAEPPTATLADNEAFTRSVAAAEGYHVHAYGAGSRVGASHDEIDGRVAMIAQALGTVTLAARLGDAGVEARLVARPTEAAYNRFVRVTEGASDPGFGALATSEVFTFVRISLASDDLYSGLQRVLDPIQKAKLDGHVARLGELTGVAPITELLPALGSNALLVLTRARLLTLSRALNSGAPGEYFSALGVVIAFQLDDDAPFRTAARNVAQNLDGRATVFDEGGATIIEFTDAQADIGNIVVTDRFLVLVPSRQRAEVLQQLAGAETDLSWIDVDAARALISAASANGLFVDVRRVTDGPIGQVGLARLPAEVRRLLGRIDRATLSTRAEEGEIVADAAIRFAAPSTTGR